MKVTLTDYSEDEPDITGTAELVDGKVQFSDIHTRQLCVELAMDADGPVSLEEAERFLRALPISVTGSMLRAELHE